MVWIGTSWKMNKTIAESREYARLLAEALARTPLPDEVRPFVLPAHTSLAAVRDQLAGAPVLLGAQNAHWAEEGAGTGEVSMRMVADAGARLVEMGHSERREQFGETDETVARKARAAVDHGLLPLICVGEPGAVRGAGDAERFVTAQVRAALSRLRPDEVRQTLIAYEPVWAIGAGGTPATPEQVAPVMGRIAEEARRLGDGDGCLALLYGGGVDAGNAAALLRETPADGLFVGRAAWSVDGLLRLLAIGRRHAEAPALGGA
ncbi:triose-phosphate isomerase [Nonomuraea pusilla]|uniref:Triosephosphate isomerase n=1 Tax=Nonomuraea pusilla TaxID=46177 RepID=A0A1H7W827_9ACTN|nr:triose-phosphate isomerase [Nonomuraea pusilla]SEM17235.1 triosephosphate isomerase [Nonomuraea pusilla]